MKQPAITDLSSRSLSCIEVLVSIVCIDRHTTILDTVLVFLIARFLHIVYAMSRKSVAYTVVSERRRLSSADSNLVWLAKMVIRTV